MNNSKKKNTKKPVQYPIIHKASKSNISVEVIRHIPYRFIIICLISFFVTGTGTFFIVKAVKNGISLPKKSVVNTPVKKSNYKTAIFDPYQLILMLSQKQDVVIIDIRGEFAYKKGHVKTAVNIPYLDGEETTNKIITYISGKDKNIPIVLYGNTQYSTDTKEILQLLLDKKTNVSILAVGWNEFRFFVNFWLPEANWQDFSIANYIE